MIYKLNDSVQIKKSSEQVLVFNDKVEILLEGLSCRTFNDLISSKDETFIIAQVQKELNVDNLKAQKDFNTLLYALIDNNIVDLVYEDNLSIKKFIIELTNICNFNCPHCYVDKKEKKVLNFNLIKKLAKELMNLRCKNIVLTGGETLLCHEFAEIYKYLYQQGFLITINTNGSIVSSIIKETLIEYPPYRIEITLYGKDKVSYFHFTKSSLFNKVVENIKFFKKNNININLKFMLTNSNKSLFWEVKALAEKLDCSFAFDYVCFPCGNNSQNIEQVSASEIIDIMKVDNKYVKTYFRKRYQNQYTSDNIFKCRIKNDSMFMSCDANISICPCMNHLKFLYKGDNLLQIVHQLKDLLNIKFQNNSKCRECHLINICRYCPGKFYMATGSYENPPQWFCDFGELVYKNFIEEAVEIRKTNQKC